MGEILQHFNLGFITSFLGTLPPGLITLTLLQLSLKKGFRAGWWYASGSGTMEFLQAFISLVLLNQLLAIPHFQWYMKLVAFPLFLIIGIGNLMNKHTPSVEGEKDKTKKDTNPFLLGVFMSSINVVIYPFWIALGSQFVAQGMMKTDYFSILIFSIAAGLGAFGAFLLYMGLGKIIERRIELLNRWLHLIIGFIFIGLALSVLYSLMYK